MKHFSIKELCKSEIAEREGIKNIPDALSIQRLTTLTDKVLDPLREQYGKPIHVNSGYRCHELNKHPEVKGAWNSQHLRGEAADLGNGKSENKKLFDILSKMDFDQLINEHDFAWVHVSYKDKAKNRRQILKT